MADQAFTLTVEGDDALVEIMARAAYIGLLRGDDPLDQPADWWGAEEWREYRQPERDWDEYGFLRTSVDKDGFRSAARATLNALREHGKEIS